MELIETRPLLSALSEIVERMLAGRDDEPAIRRSLRDGTASLRVGYDSAENVLSVGIKHGDGDGSVQSLEAVFGDGHEHAGRRVFDVVCELAGQKQPH